MNSNTTFTLQRCWQPSSKPYLFIWNQFLEETHSAYFIGCVWGLGVGGGGMKNLCFHSFLLHFVQILAFGLAISPGAPNNIALQKYVQKLLTPLLISLPRICHGIQVAQPYLLQNGGQVVRSWIHGSKPSG